MTIVTDCINAVTSGFNPLNSRLLPSFCRSASGTQQLQPEVQASWGGVPLSVDGNG